MQLGFMTPGDRVMSSENDAVATKRRGVSPYLKVPYAILIAVVAFVLMAVCEAAGITLWPVPFAMAGAAGYAFFNGEWAFPGLSNSGTKKTFGVLAPVMLLMGLIVSSGAQDQEDARKIVALAKGNPAESQRLLAVADDGVLTSVRALDPALAEAEEERRESLRAQQKNLRDQKLASEARAKEKANASKIQLVEKRLRETRENDTTARIAAYRELIELAPGNAEYAQKLEAAEAMLAKQVRMKSHPEEFLELDVTWSKGGFGAIMLLRGTIKNNSLVDLKDFKVRCEHSGPSGTVMDSNTRVVYERVNAGQTKRIGEVNMGFIDPQAATTSCEITNAELA